MGRVQRRWLGSRLGGCERGTVCVGWDVPELVVCILMLWVGLFVIYCPSPQHFVQVKCVPFEAISS